ncbi:MAG: aryl-sulfate sulfotransferase [Bacteroidia bacterium]|nr:aryl-sulfate sulfotransferase [Bacteroidia bacterium]
MLTKIFTGFFLMCFSLPAHSQQWGLYTLYATKNGVKAYLIDTADSPVAYKTWSFPSNKKSGYSAYLVPGDTLVRTYSYTGNVLQGGGMTGGVQKVTWNGTVVWDFVYSTSTYCIHHDICPMPNGNVLMISYDVRTAAEATQAGSSSNSVFHSEKIIEVKPTGPTTGTIVWEWKLWDHLCQNYNAAKDNYVTSIVNNPQLMNINYNGTGNLPDRYHMNGIDYNAALDQIVVSIHFMNSCFVIDHSTTTAEAAGHTGGNSGKGGDFLYRWGNPSSYGATGTTIFNVVHDAHWVPNDNPNYPNYLAAYNNCGGTGGKTAIDIWNPPYDGNNYSLTLGSAFAPATYNYRYNATFTATNEGNSHQLPNGNMIVNNFQGNIYEVNSAGAIIWTKTGANSSHAYRYSKCYVRGPVVSAGASLTEISPGASVILNASAISVTETNPSYIYSWSSSPSGFSSTMQNPTVTPSIETTYTVTVTDVNTGCSGSASVTINVTQTSKTDVITDDNGFTFFPNPTAGIINLQGNFDMNTDYEISIYDSYGNSYLHKKNLKTIDISYLNNGFYTLCVKFGNDKFKYWKLILIK